MKNKSMIAAALLPILIVGCSNSALEDRIKELEAQVAAPVETTTTVAPTTTTTVAPTTTTEAPKPAATTPRYSAPTRMDEELYLDWVALMGPDLYWELSDQDLLDTAYMVCAFHDAGGDLQGISEILVEVINSYRLQWASDQWAAMTAGAVVYLCPEHSWMYE